MQKIRSYLIEKSVFFKKKSVHFKARRTQSRSLRSAELLTLYKSCIG